MAQRQARVVISQLMALAVQLFAGAAAAQPASTPAAPARPAPSWRFDITNMASVLYNGDNRDTRVGEVQTEANDNWGLFLNRLNAQASKGPWQLSMRLDGAWFYTRPNPTQIGIDMVEVRRQAGGPFTPDDPTFFGQKVFEAGTELSNRYIDWGYPAKYTAAYRGDDFKITAGDFNAQLGRGLVLSVRKQDALSNDTTIRGLRASADTEVDETKIAGTLLAGSGNPLRIDEASGRYLGTDDSALEHFQWVTEAGMPRAISTDFAPHGGNCSNSRTCGFAPDNLYGAQLEVAPHGLRFTSNAALLRRHTILTDDAARGASEVLNGSQTIELPNLVDFGSLYLEAAGQNRHYRSGSGGADGRSGGTGGSERDTSGSAGSTAPAAGSSQAGYALYANLDLYAGPFAWLFEGQHYRSFFPLSAGISMNRAREFSTVQYSLPPTTEPIWNTGRFENFNTCVTGGRTKMEAHVSELVSVFGWVGRWDTWAESSSNEECAITVENKNEVWDLASGFEIFGPERKSRSGLSVGARNDRTAVPLRTPSGQTSIFYREAYSRYDMLFHVSGRWSLQLQGWHRYRRQTLGGPATPWAEGQHLTSVELAPFGNLTFGVEYDTNPRTADLYFNGQLTYRIDSGSNLSLFVGQRRGTQRCVAGVCRVFPPFEGARLDFTYRL